MSRLRSSADAVILGAGPAGLAAAIELSRAGLHTVLVDGPERPSIRVGEAIPPAAKPLLQHLGLWEDLLKDGHRVARGTESAWGEPHLRTTSYIRDPHGHGWILDRAAFDNRLQEIAQRRGAVVVRDAGPMSCERSAGRWSLHFGRGASKMSINTSWLIDCTGRRAWLARWTGTHRIAIDHLVAFVARYHSHTGTADADAMTLVESAADGWWYTVRLPGGDRLVAYLTDASDPSARMARTSAGLAALSAQTQFIRSRLDRYHYDLNQGPRIIAADSSRLERVTGDGWLAAGDAAASFDPLSSQGILTALDTGVAAARVVLGSVSTLTDAIEGYAGRINALYATYLARRREIYGQERRWPNSGFWRYRHRAHGPNLLVNP